MQYKIKTKKKELYLMIVLVALLSLFAIAMFLMSSNNLLKFWFEVSLFTLSLYLFVKSYIFRSDSSLYLGSICFLISLLIFTNKMVNMNILTIISFAVLCFGLTHLSLFLFFNKINNFFAFIFLFLLFLPLILHSFYCINLPLMLLLLCGDIVVFLVLHIRDKYERI